MEELDQSQLLARLAEKEHHCITSSKTRTKKIDEALLELPSILDSDRKHIKDFFKAAHDKLYNLERDTIKELEIELNRRQQTLTSEREYINGNLNKFINDIYQAKISMIGAANNREDSSSDLKQLLPFFKDCLKNFQRVLLPRFMPDRNKLENLSIGYIQCLDIDPQKLTFVLNTKFEVGSMVELTVKPLMEIVLENFEQNFTWSVDCEGHSLQSEGVIANNCFNLKFWIEKEAVHKICFKVGSKHILGSPLICQSSNSSCVITEQHLKDHSADYEQPSKRQFTERSPTPLRKPNIQSSDVESGFASAAELSQSSIEEKPVVLHPAIEDVTFRSCALKQRLYQPLVPQNPRTFNGALVPISGSTTTTSKAGLVAARKPSSSTTIDDAESQWERCSKQMEGLTLTNGSSRKPELVRKGNPVVQNGVENVKVNSVAQTNKRPSMDSPNSVGMKKKDLAPTETNMKVVPWSSSRASEQLAKNLTASYVFTIKSSEQSGFSYPIGVAELPSSRIVIADTFNDRLLLFQSDGAFMCEIDTEKSKLRRPSAICVLPDNGFAVRDDKAIWVFTHDGKLRNSFGEKYLRKNFGLTVDCNGLLLTVEEEKGFLVVVVMDPSNGALLQRINIFNESGIHRLHVNKPRFITFRPPSDLLVVDLGRDIVYIIDMGSAFLRTQFGETGDRPGQFRDPSGIACDGDGFIIVGDSRNHRIQLFSPAGHFLSILPVDRPLKRPSGLWLNKKGFLFVLNYWEQSLVKYKLCSKVAKASS